MSHSFHEIAFTPTVMQLQAETRSRDGYASMSAGDRYADRLTFRESDFIAQRDSFYMASVSETGWPYVQHRGGPKGFMKVLDERTLGFADYSGNRQYVSRGNFLHEDRVSLFFMDYPNRRRLKLYGRIHIVEAHQTSVIDQLEDPEYAAQIERGFVIKLEGFDWNCPAHITPRFSESEVHTATETLQRENRLLLAAASKGAAATYERDESLGSGQIALTITGIRQLTPNVRAIELRPKNGAELPAVTPGAHLRVPVRLSSGEISERHYSIASNATRRDAWEIAVLREDNGNGGSRAIHDSYQLGMTLNVDSPENHFPLHSDQRPCVLIAGGIGITPIKSMAQELQYRGIAFHVHFAGKHRNSMPYRDRLERQLGKRLTVYSSADGEHLQLADLLRKAPENALIYACGPDRLVAGLMNAAKAEKFPRERIILERFA